jgi:hypothetical protein
MKLKLFTIASILTLWILITFTGSSIKTSAAMAQDIETEDDLLAASTRETIPPTKKRKMIAWLKAGTYKKQFTGESVVERSSGPHGGNVRTFYNPILTEDLRAGKTVWRAGAAMVKELYLSGKDEIKGYAVMVKVSENSGANGEGWVFYETFDINNSSSGFFGRGIGVCANCHQGGIDYLLDPFRP